MICTCKECGKEVSFENWNNKDRVVSFPILFKYCDSCKGLRLEKKGKRRCVTCKKVKSLKDDFYKNKNSLRGVFTECKPCYSERSRKRYRELVNPNAKERKSKYNDYENPKSLNERKSKYHTEQSHKVTDWYVKKVIVTQLRKKGVALKQAEIPQSLVDSTRKSILLRREVEGGIRKTTNKYN